MSTEGKHFVFVYGTLKSGEPNHGVMVNCDPGAQAKFVCKGELTKKYPLVVGSEYYVPFLLQVEGQGEYVNGEVWMVNDPKLEALDVLERHPQLYKREVAQIKVTEMMQDHTTDETSPITLGSKIDCWVYFLPRFKLELLDLPTLKSYSSISDVHPPYVDRSKRKTAATLIDLVLP